ncbi:MAG: PAS domain S-box protein [Candidatus Heimdallarchaeota archaeon]
MASTLRMGIKLLVNATNSPMKNDIKTHLYFSLVFLLRGIILSVKAPKWDQNFLLLKRFFYRVKTPGTRVVMSRVLLVDDDEDLLSLAQILLNREEPTFTLVTATSAHEALQKLEEESFEVVVSDYRMPDTDGLVFLQKLRDAGNNIPFIMFTGQGREEVAMRALNLGADYYIMKGTEASSTFGELGHTIRQVLQHMQTEQALQAQREFTDTVINSLTDTFYIFDPEDGQALRWNKVFEEIGGYTLDEMKQKTPFDYYPPEEHARIERATKEILETGRTNVELTFIAKDGHRIPFEYSGVLITGPDGKSQICAIGRDITDRKQAEAMLQESEGRYKILAERGFDGVLIHRNFQLLDLNQQFADMVGVPRATLVGSNGLDLFTPKGQQRIREYVQAGKGGVLEAELRRNDGKIVLTESIGAPCLFQGEEARIVAVKDISKQRQAEKALRESEEKFRSVVEDQTEFVVRWLPNGVRTFVNKSYCNYYGGTAEEFIGTSFFPHINDQDLAAVKKRLAALSLESPVSTDVHRVIRPDGSPGWNEWTDRAIFGADGQLIEYQSVGRDITAQKQTEEALQKSEERFSKAFQSSPLSIIITRISDGQFIEVNDSALKVTGYSREELIGRTSLELGLIRAKDRENGLQIYQKEGSLRNFEIPFFTKEGNKRLGSFSGEIINIGRERCLIQVVDDITERKQAEKALKESEEKYRALVEQSIQLLTIIQDGRIVFANTAVEQLLGYTIEEILAFSPEQAGELVHPDDRELVASHIQQFMNGKEEYTRYKVRLVRKDGKICWIDQSSKIIQFQGQPAIQTTSLECID